MEVVAAHEAVELVGDGDTVVFAGSGAGHAVPQTFIDELEARYRRDGAPRDLTTVRVVGIGDFGDRGFSQLALPGLMKRTIGSNIGNEPKLGAMVAAGELEAYSFPQGVLSLLCREIAAGRPGLVTGVGLGTYVDPRQTGGKQNERTAEDLVEVVELRGREWLLYHAFPIDVAVIRATSADEDGNLTMEREAIRGEMLTMAMAARNSGGTVIAEVERTTAANSLPMRAVEVPGALVDHVYVVPGRWQTYETRFSPYYAGELRRTAAGDGGSAPALDVRKVIARRSLLEFAPGDVCNLGFGLSQMIGAIAAEERRERELVLTVEQGVFGGVPVAGNEGGAGVNYQALLEQGAMFDFYEGGGLDVASLSFAEVDEEGNVNVHAFGDRLRGPGGFSNISHGARKLCFVGTMTTGGLDVRVGPDGVTIDTEGMVGKFVSRVQEISFNGPLARERGQEVRFITERAVFALTEHGVTLIEVAPGVDVRRDVLEPMAFAPHVAEPLATTDLAVYAEGPMRLARSEPAAGISEVPA